MAGRGRPRFRYVAFRVESGYTFSEQEMIEGLAGAFGGRSPRLVVFGGNQGIVRCLNTTKDQTIEALRAVRAIGREKVIIATLGTSGTIRKATEKFLR